VKNIVSWVFFPFSHLFPSHRSIPADRIAEINRELEGDIMVRQVGKEKQNIINVCNKTLVAYMLCMI